MAGEREVPAATGRGDGCSGAVSFLWRKGSRVLTGVELPPPWEPCCDEHDDEYAEGGHPGKRARSDRKLRSCIICYCLRAGWDYASAHVVAFAQWAFVRPMGAHNAPPLHLVVRPLIRLGWISSSPDYRWGRVPKR